MENAKEEINIAETKKSDPTKSEKTKTDNKTEPTQPAKKGKGQDVAIGILIGVIIFLVIGLGVGAYFLVFRVDDDDEATEEKTMDIDEEEEEDQTETTSQEDSLTPTPDPAAETSSETSSGSTSPYDQDGTFYGYITEVYTDGGQNKIKIDFVQFLSGKEAALASVEDGDCDQPGKTTAEALAELKAMTEDQMYASEYGWCIPNDYYVRNQNSKIRTFTVKAGAPIKTGTDFENAPEDGVRDLDFSELNAYNNKWGGTDKPLMVVTVSSKIVTKIIEQFLP